MVDSLLLANLEHRLLHPDTVAYLTAEVSAKVAVELDQQPKRRARLESERTKVQVQVHNLLAALEADGPRPLVLQRLRERETALARSGQ